MTGAFASTLTVGETNEPIERRRAGSTLYLRRVRTDSQQLNTVKWAALGVRQGSLVSFSPPGGYAPIDPQVVFRVMAETRSPVAIIGRDQINGVRTTHYQLATSLEAFLRAEQGTPSTAALGQQAAARLDVWLDARGRPARIKASFLGRHGANMTTVVDFAAYGMPVHVRVPPLSAILPSGSDKAHITLGDPARAIERLLFAAR